MFVLLMLLMLPLYSCAAHATGAACSCAAIGAAHAACDAAYDNSNINLPEIAKKAMTYK